MSTTETNDQQGFAYQDVPELAALNRMPNAPVRGDSKRTRSIQQGRGLKVRFGSCSVLLSPKLTERRTLAIAACCTSKRRYAVSSDDMNETCVFCRPFFPSDPTPEDAQGLNLRRERRSVCRQSPQLYKIDCICVPWRATT